MKKLTTYALLGGVGLALVACGNSDDASGDAQPETVEIAADAALEAVVEEPIADEDALGPPIDPAETAPDLQTTEEAADAAADVAAEAQAALDALEAAEAAEAAAAAVELPIE